MVLTELTQNPISLENFLDEASEPSHGAEVLFVGKVRNRNQGRAVLGVSYDAFQPLVKTVFQEICSEARAQWGAQLSIRLTHRFGRLNVGEVSIAIGVSSPHRDEAFQASRYIIEEVKHRAPIWKQEHYVDGDSEWLQGHVLCGHEPKNDSEFGV